MKTHHNMILTKLRVGPMGVNCYIIGDPATKSACLIDPGADPEKISDNLTKNGLSLEFIINTHGHGDHIGANGSFDVPVYIHTLDKDFLTDPDKNLSSAFLFSVISPPASRLLKDNDTVDLGQLRLNIIHTPGHTAGSISIKIHDTIFTGDTLFCGGIGRSDLYSGDEKVLHESIKKKLLVFGDDVVIHPGHGESSTIGAERRANPYLQ